MDIFDIINEARWPEYLIDLDSLRTLNEKDFNKITSDKINLGFLGYSVHCDPLMYCIYKESNNSHLAFEIILRKYNNTDYCKTATNNSLLYLLMKKNISQIEPKELFISKMMIIAMAKHKKVDFPESYDNRLYQNHLKVLLIAAFIQEDWRQLTKILVYYDYVNFDIPFLIESIKELDISIKSDNPCFLVLEKIKFFSKQIEELKNQIKQTGKLITKEENMLTSSDEQKFTDYFNTVKQQKKERLEASAYGEEIKKLNDKIDNLDQKIEELTKNQNNQHNQKTNSWWPSLFNR